MVTPELNNFKHFGRSGMNEMTFYSLRDRKMRISPLIRGEKRSRQDVSRENLVFSSRGSKYPNLQETSGDEKMNLDSVLSGPSNSTSYAGPDIRNSRMPKDGPQAGGATTLLPGASRRPYDPAKALYGLRIDFDSGTVTRLYIMLEQMPKKPRKKFRKKPVDRSSGG